MPLTADELLALLPVGTAIVLASRLVLGIRTSGLFAPALLALTVLQLGVRPAAAALLVASGAGLAAAPIVERLTLPRSSRLAVMVVVVCAAVVATGVLGPDGLAFPTVVLAILVERTWESANVDGAVAAVKLAATTAVVAFAVAAVLAELSPFLLGRHWLPVTAFGLGLNLLAGSYRGLRLTERRRFDGVIRPGRDQPAITGIR